MTPLARAGGIMLSVAAHVVAGVLLVTLSAPDWTRPLFVDLVERAESIGGGAGQPGASSGSAGPQSPAAPHSEDAAPRLVRGLWKRVHRASESPTRPRAESASATAPVEPAPAPAPTPDPPQVPPQIPLQIPKVAPPPESPAPTASAQPAPNPLPPVSPAPPGREQPPAAEPSAPSKASASAPSDASPGPTAETGRGPVGGRGADGGGRGEVRGNAGSSTGGASGSTLALGAGGGGIPPEYGPYLQRFRQHVQASLVYPLAARRQSLRGTVELDVSLDPSGRVRDVRVARSSSHGILDDAAVDTLRRLDPLPLPESLPHRPLLIRLPLVFDLR